MDTDNGFVLATELIPASVNDSMCLPYCVIVGCHTEEPIKKVYAEQYIGLSHLHNRAYRAMFTQLIKNKIERCFGRRRLACLAAAGRLEFKKQNWQ